MKEPDLTIGLVYQTDIIILYGCIVGNITFPSCLINLPGVKKLTGTIIPVPLYVRKAGMVRVIG